MKLKRTLITFFISSAFLYVFTLGTSSLVQAQDEFILEEITVTAEKREADIQKTPLPISAVTADTLVRQSVHQMYDIAKIMPDLTSFHGASTLSVINIRGIQAGNFGPLSEPPNTVHIDGAVLRARNSLEGHFFDIERVEVLKGPQGTLYGRGAAAGTINIITRKPTTDAFGGYAEVEFGNYNMMRAEGAVNLPINDTLATRVAFRSMRRDGIFKDSGMNDVDTRSMRLSMKWTPTDRSSLLLIADFENYDTIGSGHLGATQYLGTYGDLRTINPPDPVWRNLHWVSSFIDDLYARSDLWGIMGQFDYDLDFATATFLYSHRGLEEAQNSNLDVLRNIFPIGPQSFDADGNLVLGNMVFIPLNLTGHLSSHVDTFEARLASNTGPDDTLEWIFGFNSFMESIQQLNIGMNYLVDPSETTSYAGFGQVTWTPIEGLHLTGGMRTTKDEKEQLSDVELPMGDSMISAAADYSKSTYKANVSYDITDENMIYAQYSTGFRGGIISEAGLVGPPESLTSYEFGSKNRFLDNRLQVNLEVYFYDYKNYQQRFYADLCHLDIDGDGICEDYNGDGIIDDNDVYQGVTTLNPGNADQKGFSVNLQWLITPNDRVTANLAYQNNKYGEYNLAKAAREHFPDAINIDDTDDSSGREFGPPPWRANVSYTRTFTIGDTGLLELTGDLFYEGQAIDSIMRMNEPEEYAMPGREAYWLGDISARYSSGYGMPSGMLWHVRAWVNNVWDSTDLASKGYTDLDRFTNMPVYAPRSGYITGSYVQPRTLGIAFGANW
jgi:iron complex outermembrane receptor protein